MEEADENRCRKEEEKGRADSLLLRMSSRREWEQRRFQMGKGLKH